MRTCGVEGCDREHAAHGVCLMHYKRLRRNGDPGVAGHVYRTHLTDEERIFSGLVEQANCWVWTRHKRNGYGTASVAGRRVYIHRWIYEFMVAEIPHGLELDHLCRNKACANPYHLEPVTHQVNIARAKRNNREKEPA